MDTVHNAKRVMIISGEVSGDQHGAKLVQQVKQLDPSIQFSGMGGENMRAAGVDIIIDSKNMAVVGAVEVLHHIKDIYHALKTIRKAIKQNPPDLIILIDYPGFNLRIAKTAKKAGVKVLYYISPQIWAWRQSRVKTVKKRVNKMLVIFPFEAEFYREKHVPVEFVGHPLAGEVHATMAKHQAIQKFEMTPYKPIIGILPGSRKGEIKRLLPTLLQAAELLKSRYANAAFILPLASSLSRQDIEPYLKNSSITLNITQGEFYNSLQLCDAAIVTSGTATLETALMGVPMLIVYKAAASTYHILKRIIKIPYIGLCNIVAGRHIVKEFIQHDANAENIANEISEILDNDIYRMQMRYHLQDVKTKLGAETKPSRLGEAVLELL
jgi:lipid-A-disaccharide synthase